MRRRGYGKFDYGHSSRVDYEALAKERIIDRALRPRVFINTALFFAVGLIYPQGLAPSVFVDPDTFGAAAVAPPQAQSLAPALFSDADSFGTATVIRNSVIAPSLFTDTDSFGTGALGFVIRSFATTGLVTEGDSLTAGYLSSNPSARSYPAIVSALTGLPVNNQGTTGDALSAIDSAYAANDAPLYNAATYNTIILMAGTNDIGNANATLSQVQGWYLSFISKARATGYKALVGTLLPTNQAPGSFSSATNNQTRADVNTWLRANWNTFADGLVDFAAAPELSDPTNLTFFNADTLHLTDAGYAVMGVIATKALGKLALTSAVYSDPDSFGTASVVSGVPSLAPSLFTDGDTFGTATVLRLQSVAPTLFTDGDTFGTTTVAVAASTATMDAAQTADMALSNGNLRVTATTSFVLAHSLATKPLPNGLTYFEGHLVTMPGDYAGIGVMAQNTSGAPGLENTGKSQALYNNGGFYRNSGAQLTQWSFALASGSWVGVLVDKVSSSDARLWVTIDGTNFYGASTSAPVNAATVLSTRTSGVDISATLTAASGALYPAVGANQQPGTVWDMNFGGSAWHFAPPTGYVGL